MKSYITAIIITSLLCISLVGKSQTTDSILTPLFIKILQDQGVLLSDQKVAQLNQHRILNLRALNRNEALKRDLTTTFSNIQVPTNAQHKNVLEQYHIHDKPVGYLGSMIVPVDSTLNLESAVRIINNKATSDIYFLDNLRQFGIVPAEKDGTNYRFNITSSSVFKFTSTANLTVDVGFFNETLKNDNHANVSTLQSIDIAAGDFTNYFATFFEEVKNNNVRPQDFSALYFLAKKYASDPTTFNSNSRVMHAFNGLCYKKNNQTSSATNVSINSQTDAGGTYQVVSGKLSANANWTANNSRDLTLEKYETYIFKPQSVAWTSLPSLSNIYTNWQRLSNNIKEQYETDFHSNLTTTIYVEFGPVPLDAPTPTELASWIGSLSIKYVPNAKSFLAGSPVISKDSSYNSTRSNYLFIPIKVSIDADKLKQLGNATVPSLASLVSTDTFFLYFNSPTLHFGADSAFFSKLYSLKYAADFNPRLTFNGFSELDLQYNSTSQLSTGSLDFQIDNIPSGATITSIGINKNGITFYPNDTAKSNKLGSSFQVTRKPAINHFAITGKLKAANNVFDSDNNNRICYVPITFTLSTGGSPITLTASINVVASDDLIASGTASMQNEIKGKPVSGSIVLFSDRDSLLRMLKDSILIGGASIATLKANASSNSGTKAEENIQKNILIGSLQKDNYILNLSTEHGQQYAVPAKYLRKEEL